MTESWPRKGPEACVAVPETPKQPVREESLHRPADRLRAPHGTETWFVTPADSGVATAWDTEAEAEAHAARMDPRRTVVVWAGAVGA